MRKRMNRFPLTVFDFDVMSSLDHPRSIFQRFSDGGAGTGDGGGAGGEGGDAGSSSGDGAKSGEAGDGTGTGGAADGGEQGQGQAKQDRTFTQAEVTAMMTAEKNQGRQAVLKELGITDPTQAKTLLEMAGKLADATKPADQKLSEEAQKTAGETARAEAAEQKLELVLAKAKADNLDDVLLLAKARMDDKTDFKAAIQLVKKAMPQFFDDYDGKGTGNVAGGKKGKGDVKNSYGARAAAVNSGNKPGKSSFFKNT